MNLSKISLTLTDPSGKIYVCDCLSDDVIVHDGNNEWSKMLIILMLIYCVH